jgi:hypothetical protein
MHPSALLQFSDGLPSCEWLLLKTLAQNSPALGCIMDCEGMIRVASERHARTLLSRPADAVTNTSVREFFSKEICDVGISQSRSLITRSKIHWEIGMLRGMHCLTSMIPIRVPGEGDLLLVQTTISDPVAASFSKWRAQSNDPDQSHPGRLEVSHFPIADLGTLKSLNRSHLILLRALASGMSETEIAEGMKLSASEFWAAVDRIEHLSGWGDLRGLRTHAFASGLHMFEDWYFQSVILEAAEP